ncbi:heme-copper oxidase subunit III [Halosolutus amylolyticus]|uniref:Heme-copper oxidase subunit III n=1 Tax=Halosolutus amylolyticus TaxID=2932267 RepID=A0ABD5PNC4_9EURY|nr:heme-copper oxidase subunit III [Halosolutus amylolyticus]
MNGRSDSGPDRDPTTRPDGSGHGRARDRSGPYPADSGPDAGDPGGDHGGPAGPGPDPGGHGHDDHEHEHRSRWPLVTGIGAAGLYGGVAIALLGATTEVFPPVIGVGLAVLGTIVLLAGVAGWVDETFLAPAREAETSGKSRESYVSTTALFLATDVSTFGALFVYYFFVRVGAWPPQEVPTLLSSLVAINTLILVTSSVTFHYAHEALDEGHRRRFLGLLGTTLLLGVVFLAGQAYEYYEFVVHEGFTLADGVFGSAFYGLTGLHGLHVTLGVGGLAVLCWRGLRGHYGPDRDTSVATVGLYWHFVDAVWLFLVAVVYLGTAL